MSGSIMVREEEVVAGSRFKSQIFERINSWIVFKFQVKTEKRENNKLESFWELGLVSHFWNTLV